MKSMEKKHHPLDDLFRQGLSDLEIKPSETGRSSFLEKAGRELTKRSRRTGWLPGTGIILGIALLTGAFLAIFNTGEKQAGKNPTVTIKTNQSSFDKASEPDTICSAPKIPNPANTSTNQQQNVPYQTVRNHSTVAIHNHPADYTSSTDQDNNLSPVSASPPHSVITASPSVIITASGTSLTQDNKTMSASENVTKEPLKPVPFDSLSENPAPSHDSTTKTPQNKPMKDVGHHPSTSYNNREWNIRAGIYYTPEWILNTLDNSKYVNNFGVETQFRFGPYSVRTGVGLSITRGFNEIVIESLPYLGGYKALDYITYHWDSRHYHLIPTYYTTWKEVFDTALFKNYFTLEKEYRYLQIPMILGYDFFTKKWFSLGARVGPVMSLLLKTRELTSEYDPGKDQVISINNVTPDRIHLNWQAMGGINASFRLSGLIIFELEPEIRYYFNSVYEKSSPSDKPWSIGIRGALMINF